ncbi:hypothetical protein BC937DRAFT_90532 [Endogone sp. FLAS-F59071]|nr:hypothetical protein BC937DRAFT_90532 [Endogone sp. FLAS-F59071]|eukprot:RUS17014.1 hypothetical protein BC937DRAFT_90532 [Endogone sp. FLAS-F59071]
MENSQGYRGETDVFNECHFCRFLRGRTNIYGLTVVSSKIPTCFPCSPEFPSHRYASMPSRPASSKEVRRLQTPRQHAVVASTNEVTALISAEGYWSTLTIPLNHETGKLEIISVDAFERTVDRGFHMVTNFIIAITTFNQTSGSRTTTILEDEYKSYSLQIYGASIAPSAYLEETLFKIGGSCQIINLKAAPMQLSHTTVTLNGKSQIAIILCAMDGAVHVYLEEATSGEFFEVDVEEFFPVLGRMATAGLKYAILFFSPSCHVLFLDIFDEGDTRVVAAGSQSGELHMAVYHRDKMVNGLSKRILGFVSGSRLCSITTKGLNSLTVLPESNQHDSVLCSHVLDVDWDGECELLVGTYGRQLLIYKRIPGTETQYYIFWRRGFAYPIYRLASLDVNRDGLDELIVTTMYGVHVFQPNFDKAQERLLEVLNYIGEMKLKKRGLLEKKQTMEKAEMEEKMKVDEEKREVEREKVETEKIGTEEAEKVETEKVETEEVKGAEQGTVESVFT